MQKIRHIRLSKQEKGFSVMKKKSRKRKGKRRFPARQGSSRVGFFGSFVAELRSSFSFGRVFWQAVIFDLAFYFLLLAGVAIYTQALNSMSAPIMGMMSDPGLNQAVLDPLKLDVLYGSLVSFIVRFFGSLVAFVLYLSLITGLFKGLIWDTIAGKEPGMLRTLKYSLLALSWLAINAAIFILIAATMNVYAGAALAMAQLLLFSHFLMAMFRHMSETQLVWQSVKDGFKTGIRIHRFFIQYMVIVAAYALLFVLVLFRLVSLFHPGAAAGLAAGIATVVYLAWARQYVNIIIEKRIVSDIR